MVQRMNNKQDNGCERCIWYDICQFTRPCDYYTPIDYEDRLIHTQELKMRAQFTNDWNDYIAYCDGDDIFFSQ